MLIIPPSFKDYFFKVFGLLTFNLYSPFTFQSYAWIGHILVVLIFCLAVAMIVLILLYSSV